MKEKEIWKDIKNYENKYQISNLGRVKNVRNNKITKGNLNDRYFTVSLYKDGKTVLKKVHRLVAETFIPNPYNYPIVNHKDNNHTNNKVNNLEWCTQKYNCNFTRYLYYGSNSRTKELYIQKELRKNKLGKFTYYRVVVRRKDLQLTKSFKLKSDAIHYRDTHLKEWISL